MTPNKIKVIGFDLDNTLWDTDSTIRQANHVMFEFLSGLNSHLADQLTPRCIIKKMQSLQRLAPYTHAITRCREAALHELLLLYFSENEARVHTNTAMKVFLRERNKVNIRPGALACIDELATHYSIASITNGNANLHDIGIAHYFDYSISAEDINSSKPDPELFQTTLNFFSCHASEMIYIGDSIADDIQSTQKLGISSIWFNYQKRITPDEANNYYQANDFNELNPMIEHISRHIF
jgi:FMN hydrolase / 5-amino-6-(5-phospho-D-ribitylamino)uracil phosphatase